ncbi:YlxR family protein [Dermatophilaceae bacterium Soc4.6]
MCLGCRGRDSRSVLLRVVATVVDGGDVVLTPDPVRSRPGRGAWLHPSTDCFEQAVRRRAFTRALRLAHGPDVGPVKEHLDEVAARRTPPERQDQPKAGQTLMSTR